MPNGGNVYSILWTEWFWSLLLGFCLWNIHCIQKARTGGGANLIEKIFLLLLFLLACFFRFYAWNVFMWDAGIIVIGLVMYCIIQIPQWASATLAFLGKHSYNIFLFHTFIYYYWFHDYIYWSKNPIMIPLTLLLVCILISMLIEWMKSKFGFLKLQAYFNV